MLKYVELNLIEINIYCFIFGNFFYDSVLFKIDDGGGDGSCNKELIVKFGRFCILEYFNDD